MAKFLLSTGETPHGMFICVSTVRYTHVVVRTAKIAMARHLHSLNAPAEQRWCQFVDSGAVMTWHRSERTANNEANKRRNRDMDVVVYLVAEE